MAFSSSKCIGSPRFEIASIQSKTGMPSSRNACNAKTRLAGTKNKLLLIEIAPVSFQSPQDHATAWYSVAFESGVWIREPSIVASLMPGQSMVVFCLLQEFVFLMDDNSLTDGMSRYRSIVVQLSSPAWQAEWQTSLSLPSEVFVRWQGELCSAIEKIASSGLRQPRCFRLELVW